jgi:predicted DNA-binding transcriptional regulator YafY
MMGDRSGRLFEIIQILRGARGPIRAREIAQSLEVAQRTVYRDIVTLQARGVPIEGAAGVGYVMRAGYNLPPLMFAAEEIEAVVVGLSLLGRTGDAALQAAAVRALRKVEDALPRSGDHAPEEASLFVSQWNAIPRAEIEPGLLRAAIRQERKLQIRYQDVKAQESKRVIWPIALVYYIDNLVLAAWCELREDFRHFRIDRIRSCLTTDACFKGEGAVLRAEWRSKYPVPLT